MSLITCSDGIISATLENVLVIAIAVSNDLKQRRVLWLALNVFIIVMSIAVAEKLIKSLLLKALINQ